MFQTEKENETIKDRIIRNSKTLFEQEDYYKSIKVSNFRNGNYIKYESNEDRNKSLLIKLSHTENDIINKNLKEPDIWKIQVTIEINFICSKDIDE